jgi:arylsulfatase A-like enzyme
VPKEWADKYKGKFDAGWDKYREDALARQIKLGVVPPGTKLAPKPAAIKDWDTLSADEKAALRAADGSLRGLCRNGRLRNRAPREGDRGSGRDGQHRLHLHPG